MCAVRQLSGGRMQRAARPARLGCGMECALMLQALTLTLPSPGGERELVLVGLHLYLWRTSDSASFPRRRESKFAQSIDTLTNLDPASAEMTGN